MCLFRAAIGKVFVSFDEDWTDMEQLRARRCGVPDDPGEEEVHSLLSAWQGLHGILKNGRVIPCAPLPWGGGQRWHGADARKVFGDEHVTRRVGLVHKHTHSGHAFRHGGHGCFVPRYLIPPPPSHM